LAKGEVLVLLTDGLEETANAEGELFGVDRILQAVHQNRQSKAAKIVESVFGILKDFSGNAEQVDDLTMIVAKAE
jgi:sigma-B regulation protein RsbU (phosphoserine phosphatase)